MIRPRSTNKIILFFAASAAALLAAYLFWSFDPQIRALLEHRMGTNPSPSPDTIIGIVKLFLVGIVGYLFVRALNSLFVGLAFRLKRIDAPTLIRNIFTIVAFTLLFFIAFTFLFPEVNLGALFTTSAIFGVILGLALQDTLGNFFAGISLQADRPFQVGDVISVGAQRHTGVVEEISWRAIKIRTFTNHVVLIANSNAAKEPIEVFPRGNLNARIVLFNTLYTDSPAKTIHVVREAVREADNVSQKVTPIVRIRNLGDNGIDYEVKYWLDNYAKYNDTDALVRQRIWYAFKRAGLNFAFPTRTLYIERPGKTDGAKADGRGFIERLSAVDIFAPLSNEETARLAAASVSHVF